jgi:hypothetical protein
MRKWLEEEKLAKVVKREDYIGRGEEAVLEKSLQSEA